MLGINYESSDEEEPVAPQENIISGKPFGRTPIVASTPTVAESPKPTQSAVEDPLAAQGPVSGPKQGPSVNSPSPNAPAGPSENAAPGSPYTSTRSMVRNLTLPTVPNFQIPESPPGSPPQHSTKQFAKFLELKKEGKHFNQKLENSAVLRDPSHLQKLLDYAGVRREEQYASTLPEGLAVPTTFPIEVYVEELSASHKRIARRKEEEKGKKPRNALDFVPAAKSSTPNSTSTPAGRGDAKAERLYDDQTYSEARGKHKSLVQRGDRDGGDNHSSRSRWKSRSRSPKRRRSRSRERR